MSLDKYRQKRDFKQTPEPRGKVVKPGRQLGYYIQEHHASHLHYDFRLELEGTLKSWAVPKGPSLDPHEKRLAVHVEDHPLEYGTFEGDIPPHQYGAGHVKLWDRGIWTPLEDAASGYRKGRLKFKLDGEKLTGGWTLVRMGKPDTAKQGAGKENWLLIKEHDEAARSGEEAQITVLRPESVANQPAKGKKTTKSQSATQSSKKPSKVISSPKAITGAVPSPLPPMISPQLATLAAHAPEGDAWLSEVKFDGYRALCRIDDGTAHIFTRAGNDWTSKWKTITDAAVKLPVNQAWLDGEVVAIEANGSISFQALQNMMRHGKKARLAYYVFDLMHLDGHDLTELPLVERKRLLQKILAQAPQKASTNGKTAGLILYSDHIVGGAKEVFQHACMHGLEGIVVKRADADYVQSRSRSWLKIKCLQRQEFVIGGYTDPAGTRKKFGALLVGVYDAQQRLQYAGRVGTGFDSVMLETISIDFEKLAQKTSAFDNPPTGSEAHGVHWLKPELVAEVNFAQWTNSGVIRHASFVGLRADKPGKQIVREKPLTDSEVKKVGKEAEPEAMASPASKTSISTDKKNKSASGNPNSATVAGVELSHPAKILFPGAGLTKLDLAHYYEQVGDWILPHLRKRPLTLVRCPQGGEQKCFFQKHINETIPQQIEQIKVPVEDGNPMYMMANNVAAVVSLVQMGVLELHTWGSHEGALEQPDRMIFDLDPDAGLAWSFVTEAAQLIRSLLQDIGLSSFVKTTGGKGLHVVIPLKPERNWDEVKAFSKAIAEHLAKTLPERFTANMTMAKRGNKIFIDYLRNGLGATAVAAYSTRARPNAPISTPIFWEELGPDLHADSFNVQNIQERLAALKKDPWQDYFKLKQRISTSMLKIFD